MHVVGKSMNDIYRQLCGKISVQGHEVAGTKELLNSGFTLLDITDNIANELGVGYGKYTHFAVSLHAYEKDIDRVREVWCCKQAAPHLKFDIEKFLAHISEIERIAVSSDTPKDNIAVYCFDNAIVMEVKDED